MAGYDGFAKSNNAVAAEAAGRFPATALARKLGVRTGAVKAVLKPVEWHHTSGRFNPTDYYDLDEARERLAELKSWRPPPDATWEDCYGEYIEWSGSRAHPHATRCKFTGARVTRHGSTYRVEFGGQVVLKRAGTRGFWVMKVGYGVLNK
jgi:hypothetical protein